jgi:uncharacterized membrane protein SirB2
MSILLLKAVHIACIFTSYSLFFLRGIWSFRGLPVIHTRWVKIVPHVVDTCLLASAVALAFSIHQYPFVDSWLTAKVVGLLIYIVLGMIALRYGKNKNVRISAWLAAQAVFFYIVLVAMNHEVIPTVLLHTRYQ